MRLGEVWWADLPPPAGQRPVLLKNCVVNLDTIVTISRSSLRERITALRPERLLAVEDAIHFSLGLTR